MDNFMDKLTKRFNAGEMILANGEAEAREQDRLKKQVAENEKILQEVRRLNLKTVEISEQISQMAAASIEQIESYEAPAGIVPEPAYDEENMQQILAELADVKQRLAALDDVSGLKLQLMQISDKTIDSYRLADDTGRRVDDVGRKADEACRKTDEIGMQLGNTSLQLKKEITDASYRMDASLSQIEEELSQNRRMVENNLQQLKADLSAQPSQSDETELKKMVEELLAKQDEVSAENAKQIKEMIASLRLYVEEVQKHIEEYVHKEDVKVYRNVQAVVTQQFSDRAREMNVRLDQMEASKGKGTGITVLLILTLLVSGGSLAIQILQMLGIL